MKKNSSGIKTIAKEKRVNIPQIQEKYDIILKRFKMEFKHSEKITYALINRNEEINSSLRLTSKDFKSKMAPETLTKKFLYLLFEKLGINTHELLDEWDVEKKDVVGSIKHTRVDLVVPKGLGTYKGLLIEIEPIGKNLFESNSGLWQVEKWFNYSPSLSTEYYGLATNFIDWFFYDPDTKTVYKENPKVALRKILDVYHGERVVIRTQDKVEKFYREFEKALNVIKESLDSDKPKILGLPRDMSIETKKKTVVSYYRTIFSRMIFLRILFDWRILSFNVNEIFKQDESFYKNAFDQLFFQVLNKPLDERPSDIMKLFKDIQYLNGGLFRKSDIEMKKETQDIRLIPEGYKLIWDMLSKFAFFDKRDLDSITNENIIDPEVLGNIFEKTVPSRSETGSFYTSDDITKFMTKKVVTNYLLRKLNRISKVKNINLKFQSLDFRYLGNETLTIDGEEYIVKSYLAQKVLDELEKIKICDFAVGSGAFLIAVADELINIYRTMYNILNYNLPHYVHQVEVTPPNVKFSNIYEIKKHILQKNIYGVDIQKEAVELCELRLWLWLVRPPTNFIPSRLTLESLPNIDYNIREGNSLIGYSDLSLFEPKEEKARTKKRGKKKEFKFIPLTEVFKKDIRDFQKKIFEYYSKKSSKIDDIAELKGIQKELYSKLNKRITNETDPNYDMKSSFEDLLPFHWIIDFYPVFEKGGFDIIIGNPPFISYYASKKGKQEITDDQRYYLLNNYDFIENPRQKKQRIGSVMFFLERAKKLLNKEGEFYLVVDTNIYVEAYRKIRKYLVSNVEIKSIVKDLVAFKGVNSSQVLIHAKNKIPNLENLIKFFDSDFRKINEIYQKEILNDINCQFSVSDDVVKFIKSKNNVSLLKDHFKIQVGYNTAGSKKFYSEKRISSAKPYVKGGNSIQRWKLIYPSSNQLKKGELYLIFDKSLISEVTSLHKKLGKGTPGFGDKEEEFKNPKIFMRQSGHEIVATIDKKGFRATHSIFIISPKNIADYPDLRIVLASLNSSILTYFARNQLLLQAQPGKIPQITTNAAEELFYIIPENKEIICNLVDKILTFHIQNKEMTKKCQLLVDLLQLYMIETLLSNYTNFHDFLSKHLNKFYSLDENEDYSKLDIFNELKNTINLLKNSELVIKVINWTRKNINNRKNFLSEYFL